MTVSEVEEQQRQRYRDQLHRVEEAAAELAALLEAMVAKAQAMLTELDGDLPLGDLVHEQLSGSPRLRPATYAASRRLEREIHELRGELVRILMESRGMTVTEVARVTGISTQMVRRLQNSVADEPEDEAAS